MPLAHCSPYGCDYLSVGVEGYLKYKWERRH